MDAYKLPGRVMVDARVAVGRRPVKAMGYRGQPQTRGSDGYPHLPQTRGNDRYPDLAQTRWNDGYSDCRRPVGADLSAKRPVQPTHFLRLPVSLRGQASLQQGSCGLHNLIVPTLRVGMHRLTLRVRGRTLRVRGCVTTRSVGTMRYRNPAADPLERRIFRLPRTRGSGLVREEAGTADAFPAPGSQPSRASLAPTGFVRVTQLDRPHALRGNASTDAPRYGQDAELPGLRYHAERGNDEV
jgi:hypothetical protein